MGKTGMDHNVKMDQEAVLTSQYSQQHGACCGQDSSSRPIKATYTPSGISCFDNKFVGLVSNALNIVRTSDEEPANVIQGSFVRHGLSQGEKVVLISYLNPKHYFRKLGQYGFTSLKPYLESEQLIYLYYKPSFTKSFHLSFDYKRVFNEIDRIAGKHFDRLVLDHCDLFFNFQSPQLAKASAVNLMSALEGRQYTTLGTFLKSNEQDLCNFGEICKSTMVSYMYVDKDADKGPGTYKFDIKKLPHFSHGKSLTLKLGGQQFAGKKVSKSTSTQKSLPVRKPLLLAH